MKTIIGLYEPSLQIKKEVDGEIASLIKLEADYSEIGAEGMAKEIRAKLGKVEVQKWLGMRSLIRKEVEAIHYHRSKSIKAKRYY